MIDSKADMGIIFDTDVDRSAVIDEKGDAINRNGFIAFIASMLLEKYPGTTIVTDSVTSTGLTEYIEGLGGHHHRFKRGYKNVINEAVRLNEHGVETHLAMETSGHGAIRENYFLDDGAYLVTMALIKFAQLHREGKPLSVFLKDLKEPAEAREYRFKITAEDFKAYGQEVLDGFRKFAEEQPGWTIVEPNFEAVSYTHLVSDSELNAGDRSVITGVIASASMNTLDLTTDDNTEIMFETMNAEVNSQNYQVGARVSVTLDLSQSVDTSNIFHALKVDDAQ